MMAAEAAQRGTSAGATTGLFLYGVVPADVEPAEGAQGLGEPPATIQVLAHGDIAALVSEVSVDQPLGRPAELRAYERLLDGTATVAPVLPVRFGAVLADRDAVTRLLSSYHDQLRAALDELEGRVEFAVRGRYVEQTLFDEVLDEHPELAGLRDEIRARPEEATVDLRVRLGEAVNQAVEGKRAEDTQRVVDVLEPLSDQVIVRPATHEEDAANVAALVEVRRREELERAVRQLSEEWSDRITVRLLGPLAPYDFVGALQPEA